MYAGVVGATRWPGFVEPEDEVHAVSHRHGPAALEDRTAFRQRFQHLRPDSAGTDERESLRREHCLRPRRSRFGDERLGAT